MGGSFAVESNNQFLRPVGRHRVMVVELREGADAPTVTRKDWVAVETVGTNMVHDALEIFGSKIDGEDLARLAVDLARCGLWVNRLGSCFLRQVSPGLELCRFDWSRYGLESRVATLEGELQERDGEVARLKEEMERKTSLLRNKTKELETKEKDISELKAKVEGKNEEIKRLKREATGRPKNPNMEREMEGLKKQLADKEGAMKLKDDTVAQLRSRVDSLKKDLEGLRGASKGKTTSSSNESLRTRLDAAINDVKEKEKQLSEAKRREKMKDEEIRKLQQGQANRSAKNQTHQGNASGGRPSSSAEPLPYPSSDDNDDDDDDDDDNDDDDDDDGNDDDDGPSGPDQGPYDDDDNEEDGPRVPEAPPSSSDEDYGYYEEDGPSMPPLPHQHLPRRR